MTPSLWIISWVAVIFLLSAVALYFDKHNGSPKKTEKIMKTRYMMRPRIMDAEKERRMREKAIEKNGLYGWMFVGKEFRPIRITGSRNGKLTVRLQHNYERDDDPEWTVTADRIYLTEYTPGDYARLWQEHLWRLEHAEDELRAREWRDQHYDERPQ